MNVKTGIDALRPEQLKGQKVGLVTNHTGIDRRYRRTATALKEAGVQFLSEPQLIEDWGMRCTYFRDPEGNLFELNDARGA